MATESAKYLSTLHKQVDQYFSFSEVRTLCFNLGVDYENIPGDHRSAFVRNLIVSLAKQGRLQELIDEVRLERPRVDWQDVPPDFELPTSIAQESIQQVVNYHVYGDYVGGDKISVGDIHNAQGVAIGSGASALVQQAAQPAQQAPAPEASPAASATIEQAVDKLKRYLLLASSQHKATADELANGIDLILAFARQESADQFHLKLLCLGQIQLSRGLRGDIPGIEEVVEGFVTAVQQQT